MRCPLLAVAVVLSVCQVTSAADRIWSVTNGNWSTAANWGGTEPTYGDYAKVGNGGTVLVTKSGELCKTLGVLLGSSLQMTGGTLNAEYSVGVGTQGTITHSGGTLTTPNFSVSYQGLYSLSGSAQLSTEVEWISDNYNTQGTFTQTGGTNTTDYLRLGDAAGATGNYNLSGTGRLSADSEHIGGGGTGTFTQSGGTNTVTELVLGRSAGSRGTYNLTSGVLHVVDSIEKGSGTAVFNLGGGTIQTSMGLTITCPITLTGIGGNGNFEPTGNWIHVQSIISGPGGLNKLNWGSLWLDGTNTYQGGTTVQRGTLWVRGPNSLGTGGLTVNDGTVYLDCSITLPSLSGSGGILNNNYAAADTTTLTINSSSSTTFAGAIQNGTSKTLALTKAGTGTLTLTGTSSYTGQTLINGGALAIEGSIASSNVIVNNGGTLKGSGTVGGVTVNAGGKIAPGSSLGVLTVAGDLTLNDGALLDFELDTPTASDQIALTSSTLYLNGLEFSDFHFSLLSGFGSGTYMLIDAGSIVGNLGSELVGTLGDYTARLALAGNDVVLRVGDIIEVPEPATASLLGLGVAMLVFARRRVFSSWRTGDT